MDQEGGDQDSRHRHAIGLHIAFCPIHTMKAHCAGHVPHVGRITPSATLSEGVIRAAYGVSYGMRAIRAAYGRPMV